MARDLLYAVKTTCARSAPTSISRTLFRRRIRHARRDRFSATDWTRPTKRLDANINSTATSKHGRRQTAGGAAALFEVAATWKCAVCRDVSDVIETVDALVQHAPLNQQARGELLPEPLVADPHDPEHGSGR